MIIYLTYNDNPSGIFSSQVIDVVNFYENTLKQSARLIALVSVRNFFSTRKKIKQEQQKAIVLPMFPKIINWEKNYTLLAVYCFMLKPTVIIGRSVLATQLALKIRNSGLVDKVVYDGRGAISAEWKEYGVINVTSLINQIEDLEKYAVQNADFRIAVSHQLVKHWQKIFNYGSNEHVVIPCTINKAFEEVQLNEAQINYSRHQLGLDFSDVVFIYSGSLAGWQSFDILHVFLRNILDLNKNNKVVFLSELDENIFELQNSYPGRVIQKKVSVSDVSSYLTAADYGLLIRKDSVTNQVASPVKFAEYLACGLKVIISDGIGDYTDFVNKHNCGYHYHSDKSFKRLTLAERLNNHELCLSFFSKTKFSKQFLSILTA